MANSTRARENAARERPPGASPPPAGPPDSLGYHDGLPVAVLKDMRTVDPSLSPLEPEPSAADLVRLAIPVVDEIRRAALETFEPGRTRLAFAERQNQLTGAWGIVVCRQDDSGSQSRPFAELLTKDDELTPAARKNGDALGWAASNRRLSLVACRERVEDAPRRFVMLAGRFQRSRGKRRTVTFLARVLVTPFEVAQWREPDERWLH